MATQATSSRGAMIDQPTRRVTDKTKETIGQVADTTKQQANNQRERLATGIHQMAESLRQTGEVLSEHDQNLAGDYTRKAATHVERVAGYVRESSIDQIVGDVEDFARRAEAYWDPTIENGAGGVSWLYGLRDTGNAYFDDTGWWGVAYLDAYRATNNKRWLWDAARALGFIDRFGWDKANGGVWWNVAHDHKTSEPLVAGGGAIAYGGFLAIAAAIIIGLHRVMPWWAAALLVGLVLFAIGYFMIQTGIQTIKKANLAPRRTVASLRGYRETSTPVSGSAFSRQG